MAYNLDSPRLFELILAFLSKHSPGPVRFALPCSACSPPGPLQLSLFPWMLFCVNVRTCWPYFSSGPKSHGIYERPFCAPAVSRFPTLSVFHVTGFVLLHPRHSKHVAWKAETLSAILCTGRMWACAAICVD